MEMNLKFVLRRTSVSPGLGVVTDTGVFTAVDPSLRLLVQHSVVITSI